MRFNKVKFLAIIAITGLSLNAMASDGLNSENNLTKDIAKTMVKAPFSYDSEEEIVQKKLNQEEVMDKVFGVKAKFSYEEKLEDKPTINKLSIIENIEKIRDKAKVTKKINNGLNL